MIEALVLGIEALTFSANQALGEEEEKLASWEIFVTMGFALAMAILLFVFLPVAAAHLLNRVAPAPFSRTSLRDYSGLPSFWPTL